MQQQPQARLRPERLLPDDFWMFSYKVARCPLKHSHDWEKCVYAHDGEKARRRPPQCYSAVMCPEARAKKVCPRGEDCPCTHHLFEYWLHPDRYMTCLCELGAGCNRPICFFAHHPSELRPLPDGLTHAANATGSSKRRAAAAAAASAAAAAAVQSGGAPSSSAPLGARQLSGGSLASSGGSHGPSSEGLAPVAFSTGSMGGVSMPQLAGGGLSDPYIRPGFSALGSLSTAAGTVGLSSSSLAAADALGAQAQRQQQQQQQVAGRAASTGSNACPSVLVLEAPPPVTMAPSQDLQLLQAAQQFSQLNLSAAATGWLSPTGAMAQSTSNMSLASSTSSTLGIGMAADAQLLLGAGGAGTSTAMLLEAAQHQHQQQQLMQSRSISPSTSPMPGAMSPLGVLAGGSAGSSSGARLVQPGAAYSNLLRPAGNAQLAGTPVAMEETPEHLSFSLWDLDALAGGAPGPTQAQQLAARAQGVRQSPVSSGLATPDGFGGFASRYGRGTVPAAAAVLDLAGAAADRLLQAQRAGSGAGAGTLSEPLLSPLGVGSDAETAKEARLTLLRAWVNAAAGAAAGMSRSADGSSLQQQQDGVLSLGGATFQGGAVGAGGRVGGRGLAVVAQDMASVLAPAELLLLVQQLQGLLQN